MDGWMDGRLFDGGVEGSEGGDWRRCGRDCRKESVDGGICFQFQLQFHQTTIDNGH